MMKNLLFSKILILALLIGASFSANAQKNVGIGTETPDPSAILDLNVSDGTLFPTKMGLLVPRMTEVERNAIASPANGLLVYITDTNPGFYFFNGSEWIKISMAGDPIIGSASGDLSGEFPNPSVKAIQGHNVSNQVPNSGQALIWDGTQWQPTDVVDNGITSVALTLPAIFSISGSPLTSNGTIEASLVDQVANTFLAAPADATGEPVFRKIVEADIDINFVKSSSFEANALAFYQEENVIKGSENLIYNATGDIVLKGGNIDLASIAGGTANSIKLYEGNAGENYIALKSPEDLTENNTYTLPGSYPIDANNKYLVSDVNGNLSWEAVNTGGASSPLPTGTIGQTLYNDGSDWLASNLIINNGTKVGINTPDLTTTPDTVLLDVTGDVRITGDLIVTGNIDPISITLIPQATSPTTTMIGTIYFDNETNSLKVLSNGAEWKQIAFISEPSEPVVPASNSGMPSGAITQYAGINPPNGWLVCDGSAVSRTTYSNLFNIIGTSYGAGDGSTTFNLPNFSGKMPMGAGNGFQLAQNGGKASFTLDSANMPRHNHRIIGTVTPNNEYTNENVAMNYINAGGPEGLASLLVSETAFIRSQYSRNLARYLNESTERNFTSHTIKPSGGSNDGLAIPTLPPYIVVHYIIKY